MFTKFRNLAQPRLEIPGPLAKAIAQQSAEWLESVYQSVYDALQQELAAGRTVEDIQRMLRRIFGWDVREQFQLRILQAAEHMMTEQIGAHGK